MLALCREVGAPLHGWLLSAGAPLLWSAHTPGFGAGHVVRCEGVGADSGRETMTGVRERYRPRCEWDSFAPRRGSAPTARQTDLCWCVASLTHVRSPVASDCCAEKLIPHHVPFLRAGKTLSHGLRDQTSAEMAAAPVALERSR